jgi:hypothetical protein
VARPRDPRPPHVALALAIPTVTTCLPSPGTHGDAAMWAVCAVAILASIPFARRLRDDVD